MNTRVKATLTISAMCFLLPGCETLHALSGGISNAGANVDGGANDVRYWDPERRAFTTTFFDPIDCITPASANQTPSATQECLHPPKRLLTEKDTLSVRLLRAYICDFSEHPGSVREQDWPWNPPGGSAKCAADPDNKFATRGEVAVLAKVFERDSGAFRDFKQSELAPADARLIYYSEDMRETGQAANFANIPLYGPVAYTGHPLALQLYVIELDDAESKAQRDLLSSLSKLGAAAYPPASSALSILDKVGSAFLSGQQDDLMVDFMMEFDARHRTGDASTAPLSLPLAEGVYAVVRTQDRNVTVPWDELQLDHRSGHIRCKQRATECILLAPSANANPRELESLARTRQAAYTYFVFEIRRNELEGSGKLINLSLGDFIKNAKPADGATTPGGLATTISQLAASATTDSLVDKARNDAINLNHADLVIKARARLAFVAALCAGTKDAAGHEKFIGIPPDDATIFYLLGLVEPGTLLKMHTPSEVHSACTAATDAKTVSGTLFN